MDAKTRIEELKKTLEYHSNRYYNMDDPEISDYEYDSMMQELKKLEKEHPELVTPDSPTQRVGGTAKREAGVLVRHNVPMLSLQDVFSKEEVCNFVNEMKEQLEDPEFVVEDRWTFHGTPLRGRRFKTCRDTRRRDQLRGRCDGERKSDTGCEEEIKGCASISGDPRRSIYEIKGF